MSKLNGIDVMTQIAKINSSQVRLCFSNLWRLRNDCKRVVIYKYSTEESEWRVVPPQTALALSLFDGERTLQEVAEKLESLVGLSKLDTREYLTELVAQYYIKDNILVESNSISKADWCVYDPADMIIAPSDFKAIKRLEAPLSLLLMPFNTCDVDCRYCYSQRKPVKTSSLLSIQRWRETISEAADAGVSVVTFSGGDPMRYPEILQLMDILIERDFTFMMSTKSPINDDTARQLMEMGLGERFFQISIDAWSPKLADFMVKKSGYRDRAIQSIKNLVRYGIKVRTNTVCTPSNYQEAPELIRQLQTLGVTRSTVTVYGRSMYRHNDALFVSADQMDWLREQIEKIRQELPNANISFNGSVLDHNAIPLEEKKMAWKSRANCSGGITSMTICADGRVILCEQMPHEQTYTAGSIAKQGLLEIWHSSRMMELAFPKREQFEKTICYDCDDFDSCHQETGYCFRDALNVYGNVYMPPPNCPKAPPSVRLS